MSSMRVELGVHQLKAIVKMKNGCILCGDVGTGKSRTAIAYYILKETRGSIPIVVDMLPEDNDEEATQLADYCEHLRYSPMEQPRDLYIITTAKKRDSGEWEEECLPFGLVKNDEGAIDVPSEFDNEPYVPPLFPVTVHVDSWNNIKKYTKVHGAFFIFDEQRVVGTGAWVKAFLKIANRNRWILLSATPGDTWSDYMPVFIANHFYHSMTDFRTKHVVYNPFVSFRKIDRYINIGILTRYRNDILVTMKLARHTVRCRHVIQTEYDKDRYSVIMKQRWNPYEDEPIDNASELCYLLRKVVNEDPSRVDAVADILEQHPKAIIFYNYTYELELLRELCERINMPYSEWNGEKHELILDGDRWVYLVQYIAGAEGWNCTTTDTMIFYSQNYSYRATAQAEGRIDRLNTPYVNLYYYRLRSTAPIDMAIARALGVKKKFNEKSFIGKFDKK